VENGDIVSFEDVSCVFGGSRINRLGCVPDLVVGDDVYRTMNVEIWSFAEAKRL